MDVPSFFDTVPGFYGLVGVDKILATAWYLHHYANKETFTRDDLRQCFKKGHVEPPDLSVYIPRMEARRPPQLLRGKGGYRLEGAVRRRLDAKYGQRQAPAPISVLLTSLPDKVPDVAQRDFLRETLSCYQAGAFRAATVMAWNLAFDHFCGWIMRDPTRASAFAVAAQTKFPKRPVPRLRADLEDLKESEVIEVARTAKIISKNVQTILQEKLRRRNIAAHPSAVVLQQPQADDTISDLVNNVVLALT